MDLGKRGKLNKHPLVKLSYQSGECMKASKTLAVLQLS